MRIQKQMDRIYMINRIGSNALRTLVNPVNPVYCFSVLILMLSAFICVPLKGVLRRIFAVKG
jgi:hypothetical protein